MNMSITNVNNNIYFRQKLISGLTGFPCSTVHGALSSADAYTKYYLNFIQQFPHECRATNTCN